MAFLPLAPLAPTIPGPLTITPGGLTVAGAATFSSVVADNAGTNSAGSAPLLTPANANGTAAQLADTTRDYMVYLTIGTAGTALTVKIGPTSGVADTIYTAATATAGQTIAFRLPAGWFWQWAATTATLAEQTAIGC
jgi:hypothetical protein